MKIAIVFKYGLPEKQLDISQFSTCGKSAFHFG